MTLQDKVNVLVDDLRASQDVRKQTFGDLAKFTDGKINSYCALGALGCQKRLLYIPENSNYPVLPDYVAIVNAYGLDEVLEKTFVFPLLPYKDKSNTVSMRSTNSLTSCITICNDTGYFTFREIADVILLLHQNGFIKECTQEQEEKALSQQRALNDAELQAKYESMPEL